ncbi:unnamed protein product [Haemonchus placei]|uniref:Uncharacterized protein n=1 Tax=Haemonchus placei TaxID=6290 RepID=A0A3P7TFX4_HAEPC|nr:unnamed protein product [Haemonchus placei]
MTIIALSIAFCSAVVTMLVANYMYTGLPCRDDPKTFSVKNDEVCWILVLATVFYFVLL